jgi:HD-like signal output (HDOD) protein
MIHIVAVVRLAELWKLPEFPKDSIANHNNPENAKINSVSTHTVYFVDLIKSRFHTGIEIERLNTNNFSDRFAVLGLQSDEFINLVNSISWKNIIN